MEVRLPAQKLAYLTELLDSWDHISSCSKLQVEELTGFLQFASQVVPTARAALRGLYDFSASFTSRFQRRVVPKPARRDIAWWKQFALSWNGTRWSLRLSVVFCPLPTTLSPRTHSGEGNDGRRTRSSLLGRGTISHPRSASGLVVRPAS
ncbi:hypothetical protein CPC08DRAFT_234793 [Agrocybe pediades]|nr:hypothetical protein CPC08DRAFT_234793 [Agrocybe pediades]